MGTNDLLKSKVEHFRKIVDEKKPALLVFAGDAAQDMMVAKEFGAKAIRVLTNRPKEELEKTGATVTCVNPLEAIPLIKFWL